MFPIEMNIEILKHVAASDFVSPVPLSEICRYEIG